MKWSNIQPGKIAHIAFPLPKYFQWHRVRDSIVARNKRAGFAYTLQIARVLLQRALAAKGSNYEDIDRRG